MKKAKAKLNSRPAVHSDFEDIFPTYEYAHCTVPRLEYDRVPGGWAVTFLNKKCMCFVPFPVERIYEPINQGE